MTNGMTMIMTALVVMTCLSGLFGASEGTKLLAKYYRFVNAVPGAPVDLYVNGELRVQNASYPYIGDYSIELNNCFFLNIIVLTSGQNFNNSLATTYVEVPADASYSIGWLARSGSNGFLQVTPTSRCFLRANTTLSQIEFANFDVSGNFPYADISYKNTYLFRRIVSNSYSKLAEIRSGRYTFRVTGPTGAGNNITTTLLPGRAYVLALFGGLGQPSSFVLRTVNLKTPID
eukprot:TRINITY_DN1076_c0_g1_i4.p1 TRINITY_DN1076_c0_g1~~TRINITY_DN1076_c0_g1_i4.p1  ORF type:complete len:270 (-),score=50.32 TRINITY_DN1076_c0_g1_i4:201-896(-)